jgi:hypothetical protein
LALPGVCPDGRKRKKGNVRALDAEVLGPGAELRLVHPHERAEELSGPVAALLARTIHVAMGLSSILNGDRLLPALRAGVEAVP